MYLKYLSEFLGPPLFDTYLLDWSAIPAITLDFATADDSAEFATIFGFIGMIWLSSELDRLFRHHF